MSMTSNSLNDRSGYSSTKNHLFRVQSAMQLSKLSVSNITSAHLACQEWNGIFQKDGNALDRPIAALCHALYASCLVRVGQDEEAIHAYESALGFEDVLDSQTHEKLILGKAQALQRCLKYEDACEQYLMSSFEQAALGAATCALRLKRLHTAKNILREFCKAKKSSFCPEATCMLRTLEFLDTGSLEEATSLVECSSTLPLYHWIAHALLKQPPRPVHPSAERNSFLELITFNLSPFDDPNLMLLDDKIFLHDLLSTRKEISSNFWPEGYVTSRDQIDMKRVRLHDPGSLWFLKRRSGYGSHGNQILKLNDAMKAGGIEEPFLLQRMIEPSFLLGGYKFSLRIYVIYFGPEDIYISTLGLVKLASAPTTTQKTLDPRVHMTNSGRESSMGQKDLKYLSAALEKSGYSYDVCWSRIKSAVKEVFGLYCKRIDREVTERDKRAKQLCIPKIMGFDFVVGDTGQPWLVEVNRFPGLEPRDENDGYVKHQVVRDAWAKAGEKLAANANPFQDLIDDVACDQCTSFLQVI
jgi:hypothetical protein